MGKKVVKLKNGLTQVITYFDGTNQKEEEFFLDDKGHKQGIDKKYHRNGQLFWKCMCKDNKLEGIFEGYHENGQLEVRCIYKDNKLEGLVKGYHNNGQVSVQCMYKDGNKEGLFEAYDKGGQLIEQKIYKDDELVDDKLNPERKGLNNILKSLNKNMEPNSKRREVKKVIIEEYRKRNPRPHSER